MPAFLLRIPSHKSRLFVFVTCQFLCPVLEISAPCNDLHVVFLQKVVLFQNKCIRGDNCERANRLTQIHARKEALEIRSWLPLPSWRSFTASLSISCLYATLTQIVIMHMPGYLVDVFVSCNWAEYLCIFALSVPPRLRYDTRCYFNVRSKADMSQLNLPHGNDN